MKFKYYLAASLASLATTMAIAPQAAAQQITTGIEGRVNDDLGNAIPGATVTVTDTRTGAIRSVTTTQGGSFSFNNLVTGGPYTVAVTADGFEGQTISDITTSLQGNTSLAFSLMPGGGTIVVSAARVQLAEMAVGPGVSFAQEVLEAAPSFNRDVRDIIRIDPRVSLDRDDGGSGQDRISCLGGNDRGNAFTVDGISQGDIYGLNDTGFSSRSSTPLPYDAIRETQVQFAPFDVDYSSFTGCAINVVTKSGSNDVHGSAFYEFSNSGLRGNVVDGRPVAPIRPDRRWGATLGLPVIQDKLFLFGAYEHQEAGQSQDDGPAGAGYANELAGVPVAAFNEISSVINSVYGIDTGPLVTNRPFSNDRYFLRADWQINEDHRFEATFQRLEEASVRSDDFFTSANSPQVVGENTFYLSGTNSNYYSGRLYSQWTDAFSTELRYSRSEVTDVQDPIGGGEAQSGSPIYRIIVGIDNATGPDGAVMAGPGTSRSANDLQTEVDVLRAVANFEAGDHTLKLGGEYNQADLFNLFVQNATGTLVFRNVSDLREGLLSPGLGNNQTSTTPANIISGQTEGAFINRTFNGDITEAAAAFRREIFSAFVQDEWRMTDRLTTVVGLRVDSYFGGNPQRNVNFERRYGFANTTGFDALGTLFMPRFGATYELDDFAVFARPTLTGGVGVFSGGDPLVWFGNAFQNDGVSFAQGLTQGGTCPTSGQIDVVVNGQFTGIPSCALANAENTASRGLGFTQAIDPDIRQQSVLRANIGYSAELNLTDGGFFSGWNLNLDYIYSRYRNPYTVVDLSQVPNPTRGLNGFAIDGRPIYVTIDPTNTGCTATFTGANPTPTFSNVTAACITTSREDELMLTNAGAYNSQNASFILSKSFDGGLFTEGGSGFFSFGYALSGGRDRRNMYSSTAGSNYDITAASDRQNPAASRGFYSSRHNITLSTSLAETFFSDYETRMGFTFVARSGRPYSLTFTGGSVFNDNASGTDNALVYLPSSITDPNLSPSSNMAEVQKLVDFANGLKCARDYLGRTIERNTCSNDWYFDLDLSLSQEIPGPGRLFGVEDRLKLFASFDNFLNFLDSDWNVQHRRDFGGRQDIATTTGVDAQGRYIITSAAGLNSFDSDNGVNVSSSVWRVKVGVSYDF